MEKINSPLKNKLHSYAVKISPYFKRLHCKPNNITTLGIIFNYISLLSLYNNDFVLFLVFIVLGHFCDTIDGIYARLYNMQTDFGYYYDHLADNIKVYALVFAVYFLYGNKFGFKELALIFIISILSTTYFSAKYRLLELSGKKDKMNKIWSKLGSLVKDEEKLIKIVYYTKYFDENYSLIYLLLILTYIHYV